VLAWIHLLPPGSAFPSVAFAAVATSCLAGRINNFAKTLQQNGRLAAKKISGKTIVLPSQLKRLRCRPLVAALLALYPVLNANLSLAADPSDPAPSNAALPDLGAAPAQKNNLAVRPGPGGITLESTFERQKVIVAPEYSNETGLSLGVALATMLGQDAAVGVLLNIGNDKKEWLINAGYKVDERQRFVVTAGQLKQFLDYAFISGTEKVGLTQNGGAISYQLQLGKEFLRFLEVNGYVAKTGGHDLADKTFAVDTTTLFELWNDPRRIAGGQVTGLQGKLGFSPIEGSLIKVSLGEERLNYDLLAGKDSTNRPTGGFEWLQQLPNRFNLKLSADNFASQNHYSIGLDRSLASSEGGRHNFGVSLDSIRGRDGLGNDTQFKLLYSYAFGTGNRNTGSNHASAKLLNPSTALARSSADQTSLWSGTNLLDQVALRPSVIPSHVIAKVDTTALPTRLIVVDKTTLPAGSSINAATGDITTPLGVVVTGIASVTRNGGAFANTSQFALSGNNLITRPSQIVQPAGGVVDTYVVTINNSGGGTTLATVVVSHGSVKVDSIVITAGIVADVTPPVTSVAPAISVAATDTTATVTQTINENGTGYYLVLPAASAAPNVAAVMAGTSFAMTAGVAAPVALTGLTASTAYKYYFVAKDAANNPQVAVSVGLAITTTAAPDITPPVTSVAPAISVAATDTTASVSQTINETGTGYYLVLPAASAVPNVAAVKAGTSFAMSANTPAVVSLTGLTASTAYKYYFVAKDAANNDQAAVSSGLAITTALPFGYVIQGTPLLTWMPVTSWNYWANANAYCTTTTINGQTGWRMPTQTELSALYASAAMNGQGWTLDKTWSSTPNGTGYHFYVDMTNGNVLSNSDGGTEWVSCVR